MKKRVQKWSLKLLTLGVFILGTGSGAFAEPAVLDVGMTPAQLTWKPDQLQSPVNTRFYLKVQRQGNLNQYGNFDYYYRIQVLRPDGKMIWDTRYGFNEEGFCQTDFVLPNLFYDYGKDSATKGIGLWKFQIYMENVPNGSKKLIKEFVLQYGEDTGQPTVNSTPAGTSSSFPIPNFSFQKWKLLSWGVGVFKVLEVGDSTYDKEIRILRSNPVLTVKDVRNAWSEGNNFGFWMVGPPVETYRNANGMPQYVFGYSITMPNGEIIGGEAQYRENIYAYNQGVVVFSRDLKAEGTYKVQFFLRDRDSNYWENSAWIPIGTLQFTLTP